MNTNFRHHKFGCPNHYTSLKNYVYLQPVVIEIVRIFKRLLELLKTKILDIEK